MNTASTWSALLLLAVSVAAQEDQGSGTNKVLCRAVCDAQDLGKLTPLEAVVRLAGSNESVARTVAAIVRHQWAELPQEL
ncbi:MAG: hypothetical protein ACI90M_004107, partial [Candidatus Azotimanducaceae bacterium]